MKRSNGDGRRQVVLVTGASSGIGLATAGLLAEHGHRVYGTSRRPAAVSAPGVHLLAMDLDDDRSVQGAVEAVLAAERGIDVLVNNAGFGLAGAIEETSLAEARRQMETNFFGPLKLCKAVLPAMRRQRRGLVVNVGSIGGAMGLPFQGLYSASKFALEGLTESLRQEVWPFGIRVVLIEPGDARTAITAHRQRAEAAQADGSPYRDGFRTTVQVIEREEERGVPPQSIARLILRLMSLSAPRVRYSVGHFSQRVSLLAKSVLPSKAFERILMRYYGLR